MSLKCSAHRRLPRTRNGAGSPWLLLSLHAQCSKATFGWFVLVRALGSGFGGLRKQSLNVRAYENYQVISCHDLLCGILGLSYMCSRCEGALVSSAYSRTPLNHIASPRCSARFPSVPFYPFSFWVPLLKPNSRKKGTLIIKGLLGNLVRV